MPGRNARWLLLAALLAAPACQPDERPNVLLITLDTTRADRLGAMGDAEARTPTLDALAARGALFERAYASTPRTLPSHTTILTGLEINQHGVRDNGHFLAPEGVETLAERLAARGYATAAFVAAFVLDSDFGLDRGFDLYEDDIEWERRALDRTVPQRRAEVVVDLARAWLEEGRGDPFFLWVHLYDPHTPRDPVPPFDAWEDRYAAEIAYADTQVSRLLDAVERVAPGRSTLILVVGDHGESLGEHDEPTHGTVAYDSTLHVPLIAAGPGFTPGTRSSRLVQTIDVAPTILAAVGQEPPAGSRGVPLQRLLAEAGTGERTGYFESFGSAFSYGWAGIAGVRTERWKFTAEPSPVELYDVVADPGERLDLADRESEVVKRLAALYAELQPREEGPAQPAGALDLEIAEKLAALGYVKAPQRFAPDEAPDPRRFVAALGWIESAMQAAAEGRLGDAVGALEILATSPVIRAVALHALAPAYSAAGRPSDAAAAYEELISLTGADGPRLGLANALIRDDRPEEALRALEPLSWGDDPPPRVLAIQAHAYLLLERDDEALEAARAALARDPHDEFAPVVASRARAERDGADAEIEHLRGKLVAAPGGAGAATTALLLAQLLVGEGRHTEAVRLLEESDAPTPEQRVLLAQIAQEHGNEPRAAELYASALADRPTASPWRRELADLYRSLGRPEEALALYGELIAARPGDAELRLDRGVVLFQTGRLDAAGADFREALSLDASLPEASFNLGLLALESGREAEAERHLLRAVELRPDYAKAHFHLARIYRSRSDPRAAASSGPIPGSVAAPPPAPTAPEGGS
jgi:arylsulfatase A-like enzyme/Flp pilus assembly protein TadD